MNRLSSSLILVLLLAPSALAGGLQKNRVPAGARWVAHLDVEAMKASKVYEVVHEESGKDGTNEMDAGLAQFRVLARLDPTMDIQSVTVYCAAKSEKGCVALFSGNAKIDDALAKLRTLEKYHTTPVDSYMLHTWGDEHDTWYAYVVHKDGAEERVVLASQDSAELVRGVALLEHGGESLANADRSSISATPAAGSILFAAAGESLDELGDVPPVSAVARLAKTMMVDLGEDRGTLWAHVALDARTPEDAQRIHQVLQGAVALAGLVGGDENDAVRTKLVHLTEALRLTLSNTRVDAVFRYDVQALVEDLKSLEGSERATRIERKHRVRKHQDKDSEDDR